MILPTFLYTSTCMRALPVLCILLSTSEIGILSSVKLFFFMFYLYRTMSLGHSTRDALRILHDELAEVVRVHEAQSKIGRRNDRSWFNFLHHYNKESPIHWTSILVLILMSLLLIVAYGCQIHR